MTWPRGARIQIWTNFPGSTRANESCISKRPSKMREIVYFFGLVVNDICGYIV